MRRKLMWLTLCTAAVGVVVLYHTEVARETQVAGFTGKNLIPFTATFQSFQVFNHLPQDQLQQLAPGFPGDTWLSFQKTQGPSDLYLQSNTWQPGGSTGWHQHPGHSLIVITAGQGNQNQADRPPGGGGAGKTKGPRPGGRREEQQLHRD